MKQRSETEKQSRKRIRRLISIQSRRELRLNPGFQSHEALFEVVKKLPTDFEPYGERERLSEDCSCGCRWFTSWLATGDRTGECAPIRKVRVRDCSHSSTRVVQSLSMTSDLTSWRPPPVGRCWSGIGRRSRSCGSLGSTRL